MRYAPVLKCNGITDNEKAAIIGYWRSGADIHEIEKITKIFPVIIKKIIENHLSKQLLNNQQNQS